MTNSLQLNTSVPFCGTATQILTVPTTGLYTLAIVAFPPWMTSDQPYAVANPVVSEVQTVTTVADSSGSLNSTFWTFYNAGNATGYYVWYNINSAGTDPAPAGLTGIQVAGATNVTANNIASATRTAIAAALTSGNYPIITGTTNHVILNNSIPGAMTAAADGTAATGFTFAVGTTGSFGYASGLIINLKHNSTILQTIGPPTPTQPITSGRVSVGCTAADTLSVTMSSLSTADAAPNAVKGIINLFQGE